MTSDNSARIRTALPGYDIGGQIGAGGCGEVFGGVHRELQRRVAIKQIPPQFAADAELRKRFATEATLMAAIDHPHVVSVYDYVQEADLCLLVLEYLSGGTVHDRFQKEGFDASTSIAVALSCAAGLQDAHRRGVLHRDIKPANLMFSSNGTVKLTDFGIAKIMGGDGQLVTKTGMIVGTPSYIAPEQVRGLELSPATDVYALATMTYQLLSGKLPFPPTSDTMAMLFMHAYEQPIPLTEVAPGIPKAIADVVMQGLATDPGYRYDSAEAFGVALATPASQSWGQNWLSEIGVPVLGADTITAAATGRRHATEFRTPGQPTQVHTPAQSTPVSTPGTAERTVRSTTRIRPTEPLPRAAINLSDLDRDDVKPVRRIVAFRSPRIPAIVALVLAVLCVAIGVFGPVTPPGGGLLPGVVTIAGTDPTLGSVDRVDLAHPIPVTISAPNVTDVSLSLNILGLSVATQKAELQGSAGTVSAPVSPLILAGQLAAEVTVTTGNKSAAWYRFQLRSTQSPLPTATTVCIGLLALFSAAYLESSLRTLRRGRGSVASGATAVVSAVALAFVGLAALWAYLGRQPTPVSLFGAVSLAAMAAIAAGVAAARAGKVRRYRRSLDRALALSITQEFTRRTGR
ncbi:serine/threonine-protein kinase [Mycolicibacterium sp. CBMA 226]|uniref:serine/threonine-protein kinase n=1 Tax=Mycolicibacterium sp. CBMA 226 TaxID=2606611 RepID=UPI0012DBE5D2|nr:serine/threonine-protein kinase [Mycolicibacterium sp. CBMA 226]MUL76610.1 serine/threonine protein kinase [Mycolicibacterium sp. CBMA 226]